MRILIILLLALLPASGWASKVALVIANSEYSNATTLANPKNDGIAISEMLENQGFDVILAQDQGRVEFLNVLRKFRTKADASEIAMVYYAGHGMEIAGRNYLVPVDARIADERDAQLEMVELADVLSQISGARRMKMVVLDACRDNPFVQRMKQENTGRNVGRGLAIVTSAEADTLIAYAAAAGAVTPDGDEGGNSPFTAAFLSAMKEPPSDVRLLLGNVRDQMRKSVPGAAPFVYSSLGGGEYVINPNSQTPAPPPPPARAEPKQEPSVVASANPNNLIFDYTTAELTNTPEAWQNFLLKYGDASQNPLYILAFRNLTKLQQESVVLDNGAERRLASTEPAETAAEPEVKNAPSDQDKKPAQVIDVTPLMDRRDALREIQRELRTRNCYSGTVDGIFGPQTRRGLAQLGARAGTNLDLTSASSEATVNAVLERLRKVSGPKCPKVATVQRAAPKPRTSTTPRVQRTAPAVAAPKPQPAPTKKKSGTVFKNAPNYCPQYGVTPTCRNGTPINN